jgi:lactoylglutathione lyase
MKLLHTPITVEDMDGSIQFYTERLSMSLLSRREIKQNKAEIAFLGIKETNHRIGLTRWRGGNGLRRGGDPLDHIAFVLDELSPLVENLRGIGVEIAEPYSLESGSGQIAFAKDPNGIWIEPIERKK